MQQGKVVIGMGLLIEVDLQLELSDNRVERLLLIGSMGKEMDSGMRQRGLDLDALGLGERQATRGCVARTAFGLIEFPSPPQAIEMAQTDAKGGMSLGDLIEQESARVLRVVVKKFPRQSLVKFSELLAGTKGWT